jgi:hypothetical protein
VTNYKRYNEATTAAEWRKFWSMSRDGEDGNNLAAQHLIEIGEDPDLNWDVVSEDMMRFWKDPDAKFKVAEAAKELRRTATKSLTFVQVSMIAGARWNAAR